MLIESKLLLFWDKQLLFQSSIFETKIKDIMKKIMFKTFAFVGCLLWTNFQNIAAIQTSVFSVGKEDNFIELQDTIKISTNGKGNRIKIDSVYLEGTVNTVVNEKMINGAIEQKGENNQVEIEAEGEKIQRQTINIEQKGKNNQVKINSEWKK